MSLVLGVHDRTGTTDTNRQVLTIEEIVLHPSYNHDTSVNDIALLKLTQSVDLNAWSPACLPTSGADFTGQNGWVYGWGVTTEGGTLADKLLELEVPIVSDSVCATAMISGGVTITSDMLCAGGENGKDACGGDSGGPFHSRKLHIGSSHSCRSRQLWHWMRKGGSVWSLRRRSLLQNLDR